MNGIESVRLALQKGKHKRVRKALRSMHPAKIAGLLESSQPTERVALWQQVDEEVEAEVLTHVSEDLRDYLLQDPEHAEACLEKGSDAPTELELFRDALEREKYKRVRRMLEATHSAKVAGLWESLPPDERSAAWEMVDSEWAGDVLVHLHDKVRARLAVEMEHGGPGPGRRHIRPRDHQQSTADGLAGCQSGHRLFGRLGHRFI
jgi:magnesium transporter